MPKLKKTNVSFVEIQNVWRYFGFIAAILFIFVFINATCGDGFKNSNHNTRWHRFSIAVTESCADIFQNMHEFYSSIGQANPHDQKLLVASQNQLSIRNGLLLDHEWIDMRSSSSPVEIAEKDIQSVVERIVRKLEYNPYGDFNLEKVISENIGSMIIKSIDVAILGLYQVPYHTWIESLVDLLSNSSAKINLIDFQSRKYDKNLASRMKWQDSRAYYATTSLSERKFDLVLNYLVGEKLGLGRYGEDVWIDADLAIMAQMKCMLRSHGLAVVGITMDKEIDKFDNEGFVVINSGRVYGPKRVAKLLSGWTILSERVFNHGGLKVYVLTKN